MMERLQIRASALAAEADEKQQCVLNARSELAAQTATVDAMFRQLQTDVRALVQRRTRGFIASENIRARERANDLLAQLTSLLAEEAELANRQHTQRQLNQSLELVEQQVSLHERLVAELEPQIAERRRELERTRDTVNAFHQETVRTVSSLKDRLSAFEEDKMEDYRRVLLTEVARLRAQQPPQLAPPPFPAA